MPVATKTKAPAPNGKVAPKKAAPSKRKASPVNGRGDLSEGGFAPYPAILVESDGNGNFTGQAEQENGNWQLLMVFERCDKIWDDGNPVRQYARVTTWFAKSGEAAGPDSEADVVSKSFAEATGDSLDILSDDSLPGFIGHGFMLQDEDTGREYESKGKIRKAYLTTCQEYLGDGYEYDGEVRTVSGGGSSNGASASSFDPAAYLASILHGQPVADLRNGGALDIVKDDETLAEVKTILDKPTRGGLVKPKAVLIDKLIDGGYAEIDDDGVFCQIIGG